jgi:exonuclease SbcD
VHIVNQPSKLRLVHTSDTHLGDNSTSALARHALSAVVDAAIEERADALLLAGDVFDHNRVDDDEIRFLIDQLARFERPSIVLPGNHDCYDERSVYRRAVFDDRPDSIHLVSGLPEHRGTIPGLDLEVWGRPVVDHCREFRPLLDVPARGPERWRVVMGHGHFEQHGAPEPRSSPIFPEDIAAAACDYVALGHWDVYADVSQGGVRASYSGAPHYTRRGRALSHVLLVTLLPDGGADVSQRPFAV